MKTNHVESLEEIIFKNRNKDYGAYSLRKNYKNHILVAMFVALLFVGSALTFPWVMTPDQIVPVKGDTIVINVEPFKGNDEVPLKPPPLPPSSAVNTIKDYNFSVPKVTDEPIENTEFGKQVNMPETNLAPVSNPENFGEVLPPKSEPVFTPELKPEPLLVVPEMPSFPGGTSAMKAFLENHLKYPEEAREMNIQGTVYLSFVVETDGSITEIVIMRPIGGGCEEEAVRVVKSMPNWNPGKQTGHAVRVRLSLPVKFTLQ